jgi:hypothetical protein
LELELGATGTERGATGAECAAAGARAELLALARGCCAVLLARSVQLERGAALLARSAELLLNVKSAALELRCTFLIHIPALFDHNICIFLVYCFYHAAVGLFYADVRSYTCYTRLRYVEHCDCFLLLSPPCRG